MLIAPAITPCTPLRWPPIAAHIATIPTTIAACVVAVVSASTSSYAETSRNAAPLYFGPTGSWAKSRWWCGRCDWLVGKARVSEAKDCRERLPCRTRPQLDLPDIALFFHDWVLGLCRRTNRTFLSVIGRGRDTTTARSEAERTRDRILTLCGPHTFADPVPLARSSRHAILVTHTAHFARPHPFAEAVQLVTIPVGTA